MYREGELIIYDTVGVCRVKSVGRLDMDGVRKDVEYYTLQPLYHNELIFAPVDTKVFTRPIMTKEEANALIAQIADVPAEVFESSNPRLLDERYRAYLKSHDRMDQVRLIRSLYEKGRLAAAKGKRQNSTDRRFLEQAEQMLNGELAAALCIPVDSVRDYISRAIGS